MVLAEVVARVPDNLLALRLLADLGGASGARAPRRPPIPDATPLTTASPSRPRVEPRETPPELAQGDRLMSGTLADLYLGQGDREQGIAILRELARREPESPAWREKLRAAELAPVSSLSFPDPAAAPHSVPEPLPEEVWTVGEAEESDDPSTLNLFDARRLRPASGASPAPPTTLDSVAPSAGPLAVPPTPEGSTPSPLRRLRSYLARVERYRTSHAL